MIRFVRSSPCSLGWSNGASRLSVPAITAMLASQKKSPNELENLKLWVTFECWGYSPVRIKWPATRFFGQQDIWTSPHVRGFLWGQRIIKSIKSKRKRQRIDLPIPGDPINWRIEYPGTSLNNNHALHATSDWIQLKRAAHNDFFLNAF